MNCDFKQFFCVSLISNWSSPKVEKVTNVGWDHQGNFDV